MRRWISRRVCLSLARAGVLAAAVLLLQWQAVWWRSRQPPATLVRKARAYFPTAARLEVRDPARGLQVVLDARGEVVGGLIRTSPQTDHRIGYSGPNDVLVALDPRGTIVGVELLRSGDTPEHVERVRRDRRFLAGLVGWRPGEQPAPAIEAVSGATLTSLAIVEAVRERLAGAAPSLRFPDPITLTEVQGVFTNAARLVPEATRFRVLDADGRLLGQVLRTSPMADNVGGYRGPTECLVALGTDGRTVVAVRIRRSYDTESYVDQIRRAESFVRPFVGRDFSALAKFEFPREPIEGVSGATQTARAVAEGLKRRAAADEQAGSGGDGWRPRLGDVMLVGVVAGALAMAWTGLRGRRLARISWQVLLVVYLGLISHEMLSLSLLGGWAVSGLPLGTAPGLVLLAAVALLIPMTGPRQVYCHHLCPHGAAQQLISGWSRWRWTPPPRWNRVLGMVPWVLLGGALLSVLLGWGIDLAQIEPFDAWSWRSARGPTVAIAVAGLVGALFVPGAYCRFGCPTGALLSYVRSSGAADRWGRRDWGAVALLGAGLVLSIAVRRWPPAEPETPPQQFTGRTMGTTWAVKVRDEVADPAAMEKVLNREWEWAESMTSHWRTNTDLSAFNAARVTEPMPVPWPVISLVRKAAGISVETEGAYDVTVGALVRLWGFGPGPKREQPPAAVEIDAVLPSVGWRKLEVGDGVIRKLDPGLELDLSSIAVGWAVDHVAGVLDRRGLTNYLVEAGGEIRVKGRWPIAIEHPTRSCLLADESIGTSGTYRRKFQAEGRSFSHLVDPRTGRPVTHRTVSVSVRHPECALADAWAAALNVLGVEAGLGRAERTGLAAQFVVEQADGRLEVRVTSAWAERERRLTQGATASLPSGLREPSR